MKKIKLLSLGSALFLLVGCNTIIPGDHITFDKQPVMNPLTEVEEQELRENVAIYRITPQLLDTLRAQDAQTQQKSAATRGHFSTNKAGYQYLLSPGDLLRVVVWNPPELQKNDNAGVLRIEDNGNIYFPFVGSVKAAGKTVAQVRKELLNRVSAYFKEPQLDVSVASFQAKKAYVTGEVHKPGVQPISNLPLTVLDAINNAGGVTDKAVWSDVTLSRNGVEANIPLQKLLQDGDLSYNYLLKNGDILHIPRNDKHQVILMGGVKKQQNISLGRYGATLMEALGQVGGLSEYGADATGIFVIRNQKTPTNNYFANIYQLNMSDPIALSLGNQFQLKPGDIVYVTNVPISLWNRVISNVMPSVRGISSVRALIK